MEIKIPQNLNKKLESLGVGIVYLFGSEAQGTTHFASDIDFGIVFTEPTFLQNTKKCGKGDAPKIATGFAIRNDCSFISS